MFAEDISLVKNNKANSAIIIPDQAIKPEIYAAEELQYHIQEASGAKLPIYREKDVAGKPGSLIYIGDCRATAEAGIKTAPLPPSAYVIKTMGKKIFLAGKDRVRFRIGNPWSADWQGTLFAVYDFLENDLGVRWLWPGKLGEVIPRTDDIAIKHIDREGKTKFLSARLNVPKYPKDSTGWNSEKNKKNFLNDQETFLLRHRFSAVQNMGYGHNFADYWKRFGKAHPEFFSLLPNGKREPLKGNSSGTYITMCVSRPKLWKQIISAWKNSPLRNPEHIPYRPYVNACENDTPGMCTCAACRAWDAPDPGFNTSKYWTGQVTLDYKNRFSIAKASWGEGAECSQEPPSLSDRYARFYMELLKEAKKVDPHAKVIGYAYANYWEAPKAVRLDKDITISYVPPLWFPYTKKMSEEFRKNWDGWRKGGAEMVLRPNLTHAGANLPIFYARQIAGDFSYAAQRGMVASYFDSLLGAWSAQGPTLYTLVRLHEHPEWNADKILNEYYSGFGKAAGAMKKYFEYWEKYSDSLSELTVKKYCNEEKGHDGREGGGFKNYVLIASRLFPPEVFDEAHKLLENAKLAAKGDELAEQRAAYIEKGLVDAELTVAVRIAQKKAKEYPSKENEQAFLKAFEKLKKYRASIEKDNVCNFGYMAFREKSGAGWPWKNK
jgi:hypothetical protein